MLHKFVSACLLSLLLLGLIGNFTPLDFGVRQVYASTSSDTFINLFADFRHLIRSWFNTSDWYVHYPRNFTDTAGSYLEQRWHLTTYAFLCMLAYEKSNDISYLIEAQYLVEGLSQSERSASTGSLYTIKSSNYHGWSYTDIPLYWAMQKLNEYGYGSYAVSDKMDNVIAYAKYDNSTDLMWNYDWDNPIGTALSLNTWSRIMAFMGYLTNKGVKDYSDEMGRLYYSIERGRCADEYYEYSLGDGSPSSRYSVEVLWGLLAGYYYCPSVFNVTKLQLTIDAINGTDWALNHNERIAGIETWVQNIDTLTTNRFLQCALNNTITHYNMTWQGADGGFNIPAYARTLGHDTIANFLPAIGLTTSLTIPNIDNVNTPNDSGTIMKSAFLLDAGTISYPKYSYQVGVGSNYVPCANLGLSLVEKYSSDPFDSGEFNGTYYNYADTVNEGGWSIKWNFSQLMTADRFCLETTANTTFKIFAKSDSYDVYVHFSNGTEYGPLDDDAENTSYTMPDYWAITRHYNDNEVVGFLVYAPTNNTWELKGTPASLVDLRSTTDRVDVWFIMYGAKRSSQLNEWVAWMISNVTESGNFYDTMVVPTDYSEYQTAFYEIPNTDLIVYSFNATVDLSNVEYATDWLTYTASGMGTTVQKVYCGDQGNPEKVNGAISWSYDDDTKICTITVTHSSHVDVEVDWSDDIHSVYILNVYVKRGSSTVANANVTIEGDTKQTNLFGTCTFELPTDHYEVTANYGDVTKTKRVLLKRNKTIAINLPPKKGRIHR